MLQLHLCFVSCLLAGADQAMQRQQVAQVEGGAGEL